MSKETVESSWSTSTLALCRFGLCETSPTFTFSLTTVLLQVDGTISHHDMFDYISLTQKGYSKAFEPVNELLTTLLQEMEGELGRTEAEGAAE